MAKRRIVRNADGSDDDDEHTDADEESDEEHNDDDDSHRPAHCHLPNFAPSRPYISASFSRFQVSVDSRYRLMLQHQLNALRDEVEIEGAFNPSCDAGDARPDWCSRGYNAVMALAEERSRKKFAETGHTPAICVGCLRREYTRFWPVVYAWRLRGSTRSCHW